MRLVPRPEKVRGLMDVPAYTQRILDRLTTCLAVRREDQYPIIDLETVGVIPEVFLERLTVVRVSPEESLSARVLVASSQRGKCRLTLRPWWGFINQDPCERERLDGIHFWIGAAWRHLPFPRTA